MAINTITLGGLPVCDAPRGSNLNFFEQGVGASPRTAGFGRFLMLLSDYNTLAAKRRSNLNFAGPDHLLVMNGEPGAGLSITVYVMGCEPYEETSAAIDESNISPTNPVRPYDPDDLVCVIVRDGRIFAFPFTGNSTSEQTSFGYNVQREGFPYRGTSLGGNFPVYTPQSLSTGGVEWTWSSIFASFGGTIPAPVPTWTPRNIVLHPMATGEKIDYLCGILYLIRGFASPFIFNPDQIAPSNATLLKSAIPYAKGGVFARARALPRRIAICYPAILRPSGLAGQYLPLQSGWRTWDLPAPDNTGGNSTTDLINFPYLVAVASGSDASNAPIIEASTLNAAWDDVASRRYGWIKAIPGKYEIDGIWPFLPDGKIRNIRWESDSSGARTLLRINDNSPIGPGFSGVPDAPLGLGGSDQLARSIVGSGSFLTSFPDNGTGKSHVFNTNWPVVTVTILSSLTAGGFYNGKVGIARSEIGDGSSGSSLGSGTLFSGDPCVIINEEEAGNSPGTHWLDTDRGLHTGIVCGATNTAPYMPIVRIWSNGTGLSGNTTQTYVTDVQPGVGTGKLDVTKVVQTTSPSGRVVSVSAPTVTTITVPP